MVGIIWSIPLGQLTGCSEAGKVDGLKNFLVEVPGLRALEWVPHEDEGVGQTLHTNADGSVTLV